MDMPNTDLKGKLVKNNFQGGILLVVEDNDDHWLLILRGLQTVLPEIKLVRVSTAQEANTYIQDRIVKQLSLPRLVILDLYLPSREAGFELLSSIKKSTLRQLPVIVVSNSSNRDDIVQAYELGASSYFTKPTHLAEWTTYFQAIFDYWGLTVTLPDSRTRY
jgi:DNA-binding response OmpR family regulator